MRRDPSLWRLRPGGTLASSHPFGVWSGQAGSQSFVGSYGSEDATIRETARPEHPWGVTYEGHADLESVARAIEATSELCQPRQPTPGGLRIVTARTDPWYRILATARSQLVEWHLCPHGARLTVTADLRASRWYLTFVVALGSLLAVAYIFSLKFADSRSLLPIGTFFAALTLSSLLFLWLGAFGGGRQVAAVWQPVLERVEKAEGTLEPAGRTVSRRYTLALTIFFALHLGLLARPIGQGLAELRAESLIQAAIQAALVTLLLTLALMVAVGSRNGAFMLRTDPLLGGLVSTGSVLLYLSLPLLATPFAGDLEQVVHLYEQGEARLATESIAENLDETRVAEVRRGLAKLRQSCQLMLFLVAVVGLGTAGTGLVGLRLTRAVWLTLWRLHRQRGKGVYTRAIRDPRVLRTFRGLVVAVWGISTLLVFGTLVFVVLAIGESFVGAFFDPRPRLVELSSDVLALAFGISPGDPMVYLITREIWWVYLLPVLAFWVISVGQLLVVQRRAGHRLRAAAGASAHPRQSELQETVDALCRDLELSRVRVVVSSAMSLQAAAVRIGLCRPRRYVEVAADVLEILEKEDVEALLAHELAHHLEGHCRLELFLRWLGRLTFAGDGFVLLLQDSSRYEDEADRAATHKLGVPSKVLARCLRRLRNARAVSKLARPAPAGLSLFATEPDKIEPVLEKGVAALGFAGRWRLTWQVFLAQYFNALGLYYWHPDYEARKREILGSSKDSGSETE